MPSLNFERFRESNVWVTNPQWAVDLFRTSQIHQSVNSVVGADVTSSLWLRSFEFQQRLFVAESAAVPHQFSGAADDAMAGNDNRNWVSSVRHSNRSRRCRIANLSRNTAIAGSCAEFHVPQRHPDFLLKFGSLGCQRQIKILQFTRKIRVELFYDFFERFFLGLPVFFRSCNRGTEVRFCEGNVSQAIFIASNQESADQRAIKISKKHD